MLWTPFLYIYVYPFVDHYSPIQSPTEKAVVKLTVGNIPNTNLTISHCAIYYEYAQDRLEYHSRQTSSGHTKDIQLWTENTNNHLWSDLVIPTHFTTFDPHKELRLNHLYKARREHKVRRNFIEHLDLQAGLCKETLNEPIVLVNWQSQCS